jgi:5'/3'-nucleotidase SurE
VVHVTGSPATCVNLALYQLASDCDLVLSGPNIGHNVGRSAVLSSGTVGAAIEGVIAGRRAMAVSFPFKDGFGNWSREEVGSSPAARANTPRTTTGCLCGHRLISAACVRSVRAVHLERR